MFAFSTLCLLLVSIVMALSVFIGLEAADDLYNMDSIDAVVMSVYFQAIALLSLGFTLNSLKLEDVDFDVYKNDGAAA